MQGLINTFLRNRLRWGNLFLLLMTPLLSLLALDTFNDGNFHSVYLWIKQYPSLFFLSYILVFGFVNVFYILPRKFYLVTSSLFLAIFSIIGLISREKFIIKGSPLLPSDFFLIKEAIEISGRFKSVYLFMGIILCLIFALIALLVKFIPKEQYKLPPKLSVFLVSGALLFIFYSDFDHIQQRFSLQMISWSQKTSYEENGMLLGFFLDAQYLKVAKPPDYQEDTVEQIVKKSSASYPVDANFNPNIIFVMSEALWDPTLMKNVTFSQDPIPFFHSLQENQTSGIMLSSVYGGGTANTEMEALTGFSTQFLPSGVIPYAQYINRPLEALPTILQRQGYATSAIHTYDNWFYNRNSVYKNFGFDKFISKEFLNDPEYKGEYIRDTELTKKILEELQETAKPDFIYAISMQDHGPYSTARNLQNTIKIRDNKLSMASQAILENYTNTISDVDQSLEQLIKGLEKIQEPTLVIFYGDHLPLLGDNYSVYKEAGFLKGDSTYQDYLKTYSVPFVTWNNFAAPKQNLRLSSNFMGTLALEMAQKTGSPMTDFLSGLMKNNAAVIVNPDWINQEKITSTEINQYKLLQYDLLFGKEYTYQLEPGHTPPQNNGYIQGDGPVQITNISLAGNAIEIEGENFVKNDLVYINGKQTASTYNNAQSLSVTLPADLSNTKGSLKVQVKLTDSQKKVISQSNLYLMEK
jgi:phosphoglycerol transferase MdoB-like AlkP superfamily enzyme